MKLQEVTNYNLKSQTILNESWDMLTESQRIHVGHWEKRVWPLMEEINTLLEADLQPKQIQDIFANAEKVAMDSGENKTGLGKAGELTGKVTGKIKDEIQKLLAQAAESGPVKNFDQQFEKLKAQLRKNLQGNPVGQKVLAGVDKWKGFATENPAKSAFVIGAMTSLLAFASGGLLSGAAIGFFLKLANNTIKGDKLSVALAKGVKGAAIGAAAGALSDIIGDLVPPDVENAIIASDGQTIDVSGLEAMGADSLEDLDSDAVADLLKTQNALETAMRSAEGEAQDIIQAEFEKVTDQINSLGGAQELQDFAGLEGSDLATSTTTTTDVTGGGNASDFTSGDTGIKYTQKDIQDFVNQAAENGESPSDAIEKFINDQDIDPGVKADELNNLRSEVQALGVDPDSVPTDADLDALGDATPGVGKGVDGFEDNLDIETVPAETITADELNSVGINFDAEPDVSQKVLDFAKEKNLDPEKVQSLFKMEKALDDAKFLGQEISSDIETVTSDADVSLDYIQIQGETVGVDETFNATTEIKLPGIDKPLTFTSTNTISGMDADGNIVFKTVEVVTSPDHPLWDELDGLSDEEMAEFRSLLNAYTGVGADSQAGIAQSVDAFRQQLAKSIGAAATAIAVGGALADKEIEKGAKDLDKKEKKESISRDDLEVYYDYLLKQHINEAGFADMMKSAGKAAANIGKAAGSVGQKALTGVARGAAKGVAGVKQTAKAVGKELGNIVTVKKLEKAWKNAGSPTDTGSIVNVMSGAGMSDEQIQQVSQLSKIELPTPTGGTGEQPASGEQPAQDTGTPGNEIKFKPGQEVKFTGPDGKEVTGAVDGKASDGDDNKVSVKGPNGQSIDVPRAEVKDPATGKGFGDAGGAGGAAGGAAGAIDLKTLADEIKKAGVADKVKQVLAQ